MTTPQPEDKPGTWLIRLEKEVPGTPEQVWRAIASAEGLSTWYMPATVEEHEGGTITTDMGPWGKSTGTVTAWEPGRRFAFAETGWHPDPAAPTWATEFLVEARDGGTCVVRLVSGFWENADGWEEMLGGAEQGFGQALENLRLWLTHFPGLYGTQFTSAAVARGEVTEVRDRLLAAVGLTGATTGLTVSGSSALGVAGTVESVREDGVLVRISEPASGLLNVRVWPGAPGDVVMAAGGVVFGDSAPEVAREEAARWEAFLYEVFPDAVAPE